MNEATASSSAETVAVREAYAALNRGDIPGFTAILDPQIERIEFAESPEGRRFQGLAEVTEHCIRSREMWAEGGCYPERFIIVGDRVIVFVHVRVRLKDETDWREGHIGDAFTFRNGKAILFRSFADRQQALAWAGADPAAAG